MTNGRARGLGFGKKLVLALVGAAAVVGPVAIGVIHVSPSRAQSPAAPRLAFEAASIKPSGPLPREGNFGSRFLSGGKFAATNVPLKALIMVAFHLQDFQVSGGPKWLDTDPYDVNARPEKPVSTRQTRLMLQTLLTERFQLAFHRDTKQRPVYALMVAKNGPKLQEVRQDREGDGNFTTGEGHLIGQGATMEGFAEILTMLLGRTVLDMTGVKGKFDWKLEWTPERFRRGESGEHGSPSEAHEGWRPPDPDGPGLFRAIEQQLGLKLEARKGPVEILVIDHAERPTEN
jgi:uncharacterized protein (TIGR03435 family)